MNEHLVTYLNDHLAASVAAMELIEHLMEKRPDLRKILAPLLKDDEGDQAILRCFFAALE